jgi:hypothetical protein
VSGGRSADWVEMEEVSVKTVRLWRHKCLLNVRILGPRPQPAKATLAHQGEISGGMQRLAAVQLGSGWTPGVFS